MAAFRLRDPDGEEEDVAVFVGLRRDVHGQFRPWAILQPWVDRFYTRGNNGFPVRWSDVNADAYLEHIESGIFSAAGKQRWRSDEMPCQAQVREIMRHGRSYISLHVTKKEMVDSVAWPAGVAASPVPLLDRAALQTLLQPITVEDYPMRSIFETEAVVRSNKIRVTLQGDPSMFLQKPRTFRVPDYRDPGLSYPRGQDLVDSCRKGEAWKVAKLLKQGESPEVQAVDVYNLKPLHWAALYNHADVAAVLLDGGADLTSKAAGNVTPLHLAALMGHHDVIQVFLDERYAKKFPRRELLLAKTYTYLEIPLHLAVLSPHCTKETLLALSQVEPPELNNDGSFDFGEIGMSSSLSALRNLNGEMPIARAAAWANVDAEKWLYELYPRQVVWSNQMNQMQLIMHSAIASRSPLCMQAAAEQLAETPAGIGLKDNIGRPLLFTACIEGHYEVVAILAAQAREPHDLHTGVGWITPCHVAAMFGHVDCLRLLINRGASVAYRGIAGETLDPLHLAAAQGHMECVELLCAHGAMNSSLGRYSFKLQLDYAASEGPWVREKKVELLDWKEWDPPVTADHMARAHGHSRVADWLAGKRTAET